MLTTLVIIQYALKDYYASNGDPNATFGEVSNHLSTITGTQNEILATRVYTNDFQLLPNLTVSHVPYDLPTSLIPTTIPPVLKAVNSTAAGEIIGPVAIVDRAGFYALSITMPILNTNPSTTPLTLGYISIIFAANKLQSAVNDTTGMGQTGQLLVLTTNSSHYDIILPPVRTPQLYGQVILPGTYPAADIAFKNTTGYLICTHNAIGTPVAVGYTV